MTIRHLKIFLALTENQSNMTKTAEQLHMSQPAVSLAIKELELYYGVILFDRVGRKLKITEAGKHFKEYASHILSLFDDMEKGMKNWDTFGILRVGSSITIGSQFLPYYVKAFNKEYPSTQVKVLIGPSDQLEDKILNNELDFALIEGVPHTSFFVVEDYMEDELAVICAKESAASFNDMLSIEEFKQQKFLLRERGSGTRETFERAIEAAGFSVTPIWEAMSTTALVNAVINDLGIAVLPYRMVAEPLKQGKIRQLKVEGLSFKRKFHIVYHKEKFLPSSAKAFIKLCREYKSKHPAS